MFPISKTSSIFPKYSTTFNQATNDQNLSTSIPHSSRLAMRAPLLSLAFRYRCVEGQFFPAFTLTTQALKPASLQFDRRSRLRASLNRSPVLPLFPPGVLRVRRSPRKCLIRPVAHHHGEGSHGRRRPRHGRLDRWP